MNASYMKFSSFIFVIATLISSCKKDEPTDYFNFTVNENNYEINTLSFNKSWGSSLVDAVIYLDGKSDDKNNWINFTLRSLNDTSAIGKYIVPDLSQGVTPDGIIDNIFITTKDPLDNNREVRYYAPSKDFVIEITGFNYDYVYGTFSGTITGGNPDGFVSDYYNLRTVKVKGIFSKRFGP